VSEPRPDREVSEGLSRARIERRFLANSGLIIAARVVTAGLSLATIPVLVSRLGVEGYGTWEALFALASLTSLFQTAISGTLVWRISEAYGRGGAQEIRRVARLGAGASWALFVLLWPVAWLLRDPVVHLLGVSAEIRHVASEMFPVVAGFILLGGLIQTLEAVVSGCQRTGLVNVVAAGAQTLNYSVVIVMTLLGGGLWSLVAGQAVGFVSRFAGAWVAARVSFGPVSLVPLVPGRGDVSMARYSSLVAVGSVAAALRDQTDKVILASLASPAWVAYYGIAARLCSLVMEIISFFYLPIVTAVGALNAMGDWDGIRRLYSRLMATVSSLTGLVVVVVAGLADRLVILWIGHPIPEVTVLLWLLITGSASAAMLTGPGTAICRGCGRVEIETKYLTFNLVLNLILTVSLVLLIGPIGTAVATGSTWALSSILFLVLLHRALDLPAGPSRRAGGTALLAAAVAGAVYWASSLLGLPQGRHDAFVSIALLGSAGGLVYLGLVASFGLVSVSDAYGGLRSLLRSEG
jgi:O-antigen/teichoic acid export membrane protein